MNKNLRKHFNHLYLMCMWNSTIINISFNFPNKQRCSKVWMRRAALFLLCFLLCTPSVFANNLQISNVSLEDQDTSANTAVVEFDISWDNSWRTNVNHDAVWLTVRADNGSSGDQQLCDITNTGEDPVGTSVGSNSSLGMYVTPDQKGAFLRPMSLQSSQTTSSTDVQIKIDYDSCVSGDTVRAYVYGIEMVFVPESAFYAGDGTDPTSIYTICNFTQGAADYDPWYINSEGTISVNRAGSYYYTSCGNGAEWSTGSTFTIPADFPKGYQAFYAMKYEVTEGAWVEFVNSLISTAARSNRDLTDASHKNSDSWVYRNTLDCDNTTHFCTTDRPDRALGYMTWMDMMAFLDWAALRPMTELEFEKLARGLVYPVQYEYAWGTTYLKKATGISSGTEDGTETVVTSGANINKLGATSTFTGGDSASSNGERGPLRAGIFATSTSNREESGAGYYGAMQLSGNLKEFVVTVGNSKGITFIGNHGDGVLTSTSSYEGNANVTGWVAFNATSSARGITDATGMGRRGDHWRSNSGYEACISDRLMATDTDSRAQYYHGGRGVRTYDGP